MSESALAFDLKIKDLYTLEGLKRIHHIFLTYLKDADTELQSVLNAAYQNHDAITEEEHESLCIEISPHLEDFLSYLFNISPHVQLSKEHHKSLSIISTVKRAFIQRYVAFQQIQDVLSEEPELPFKLSSDTDIDFEFSKHILPYIKDLKSHEEVIKPFVLYALWSLKTKEGQKKHKNSTLFKISLKKNAYQALLDRLIKKEDDSLMNKDEMHPLTSSFSCTDAGFSLKQAIDQSHYCIKCHPQKKDSCKRGLKTIDGKTLEGCPLDEKISAFMDVKSKGYNVAALAIILVDNPLAPATGHRICNDCKKSCIFQKQESVDVPAVESQVLDSVLNLPFGFEIYSLLTKWNPLNIKKPLPSEPTGHSVLVVGQGPSGFGLSHYLMHHGVRVLAIDGLKIEPLPLHLKDTNKPIKRLQHLIQDLDMRIVEGFGGVAEYGITIRWNKNNLLVIRLLLERNALYTLKGGVRLDSQITLEQALNDYQIDHVALCMGAGSPNALTVKNPFPKGVRFASDFLMGLQLTGAFKKDSLANLTVDMPIVVIGAGLTAIDTATEAQRYYLRQIEKVADRLSTIKKNNRFDDFLKMLKDSEKEQLSRWQSHYAELEDEKERCLKENIPFNAIPLLHQWGGTTILYRKDFDKAPSVENNPYEVEKAFEEGIFFKDNFTPIAFETDQNNAVISVKGRYLDNDQEISARTVLIAVGTKPLEL